MAGDWIKMRTCLSEDPDVVRIARGLKLDLFGTVGRLHKIWAWADQHSIDGQDVPVDAEFLDSMVSTPGFSAQLRAVGWLSGRDGSLSFPNFLRHNGESAKRRAMDAIRKSRIRKTSAECPHDKRTKSGLEKRREEKSISANADMAPDDEIDLESQLLMEWNSVMQAKCQMTPKRRKALNARLQEAGFRDGWRDAIRRIAASDFCQGASGGWRADLDWFLKPEVLIRINEGKYDNRTGAKVGAGVTFDATRQTTFGEGF